MMIMIIVMISIINATWMNYRGGNISSHTGISCTFSVKLQWDWWPYSQVNIGSGNGLMPSGNKPLPEPMVTQINVTIWRHLWVMGEQPIPTCQVVLGTCPSIMVYVSIIFVISLKAAFIDNTFLTISSIGYSNHISSWNWCALFP